MAPPWGRTAAGPPAPAAARVYVRRFDSRLPSRQKRRRGGGAAGAAAAAARRQITIDGTISQAAGMQSWIRDLIDLKTQISVLQNCM
eukprot:COSAG01_NODE_1664_length_9573_cov_31.637429_16_plen_86_part_01